MSSTNADSNTQSTASPTSDQLPEPAPRRKLHTRRIVCDGYVRDDGLWDIEATIFDSKTYFYTEPYRGGREVGSGVHDMRIRLTLDKKLKVHDVHVVMPETPYPICAEAAIQFRKLIGLSIGGGWRKAVNERVGGTMGCTHVRELLGPLATVAIQTIHGWPEDNPPADKPGVTRPLIDATRKPPFIDGCYAWSSRRSVVADQHPEFAVTDDDDNNTA